MEKFNMDREELVTQYELKFEMLKSEYQNEKEEIISTVENTYASRIKSLEEQINMLKQVNDDLKNNQVTHDSESLKAPVIENVGKSFEKLNNLCAEMDESVLESSKNYEVRENLLPEGRIMCI